MYFISHLVHTRLIGLLRLAIPRSIVVFPPFPSRAPKHKWLVASVRKWQVTCLLAGVIRWLSSSAARGRERECVMRDACAGATGTLWVISDVIVIVIIVNGLILEPLITIRLSRGPVTKDTLPENSHTSKTVQFWNPIRSCYDEADYKRWNLVTHLWRMKSCLDSCPLLAAWFQFVTIDRHFLLDTCCVLNGAETR